MKLTDIAQEQYSAYVGLLTAEQKESLLNKMYTNDSYFNPIQDNSNNWVISMQEMACCDNADFTWVKDLELILYVAKED